MNMPMTDGGPFAGIAPDHTAALLSPLLVPIIIWGAFRLARMATVAGWPLAQRFRRGYERSGPSLRLVATLLLLAGTIHLLLIPAHLAEAPTTALLFALNGLAYAALSAGVFLWDRWGPLAGVLLAATLLAYLFYLATGQEDIDAVGVVAYAIELGTLGLVWLGEQSSRCERLQQYRGCEQPSADVACPLPDALCEAAFAKE